MRSLALVFLSGLAFGALASDKESDGVFLKCDIKNEKTGEQRVSFFNIGKNSYGIPYWREFNFGRREKGVREHFRLKRLVA